VSRGILYIAAGEKYANEAQRSARSVRGVMPDVDIALITDIDGDHDYFDTILKLDSSEYDAGYKPSFLQVHRTPYDRTIFLDTDTYVDADISELFDLLNRFDLVAPRGPTREQMPVDVPSAFTEVNGGVIGFNSCDVVDDFLSIWRREYKEMETKKEQPALRKALFESDLEFYILPSEYNCREVGYVDRTVKIFHYRRNTKNLEGKIERINSYDSPRVHYRRWGRSRVVTAESGLIERAYSSIREDGFKATAAKAYEKFRP